MWMNPIVKKDVKIQARSMRISWGVFAYVGIMALVYFIAMLIIQEESIYNFDNIYSRIVGLYPVLAITQIALLGLIVPVRTASAISGEKDRQTFDIMMTTAMTPFSVVFGKTISAVLTGMFYVVAGMPVMALSFVIGGMSWSYLLWFVLITLLVSFFASSVGIFCSSVCKKTISAVILTYAIYGLFCCVTALPSLFAGIMRATFTSSMSWFYLINPIVYLSEFFVWAMSGNSMVGELFDVGQGTAAWMTTDAMHYVWMTVSTILFVAISFLFLVIAAKRINPLSKRGAKKAAKKIDRMG